MLESKHTTIHRQLIIRLAQALIRLYQLVLSPLIGPACRFTPSCSEYTKQAIGRYGIIKGVYMGLKRVARCHPWNAGGYDPVP